MMTPEYARIHYWVRVQLGTPSICENCGIANRATRYEWANLSGNYLKDISDWARLCKLCHNLMDNPYTRPTHCKRGHEYTPENTKLSENKHNGAVYISQNCKECLRTWAREYQRIHQKEYRRRRKELAL